MRSVCLFLAGFFIKTGMKKACMAKAKLIVAPKEYKSYPKGSQVACPLGAVAITQIRKIRYEKMLTIPYAIKLAPKSKYFSTKIRMNNAPAFTRGIMSFYFPVKDCHCKQMS